MVAEDEAASAVLTTLEAELEVPKDGAEGVYVVALPDGRAVALKVADGANRARPPLMRAALAALGIDVSGVDPAAWASPVMGHGRVVGEVRVTAGLG